MKKFLKTLKILGYGCVFIVLLDAFLVFGIGGSNPEVKEADAIVVLGAAIYSPALYNRSLEAVRLYNDGKAQTLVLSGGRISNKDISEAGYMKKVIVSNIENPPTLILDETADNTYENIKNARSLLPEAKSVIIVSDRFHLARAVLLAKRAGFEDVYWSAPEPSYYRRSELAFYYFREMAAMVRYVPKFIAF